MNEKKKFGIYRHAQKGWDDNLWERVKAFDNPHAAAQSLRDLTKRRKEKRLFVYTVLPIQDRKRYVLVKEEHAQQLLKAAR